MFSLTDDAEIGVDQRLIYLIPAIAFRLLHRGGASSGAGSRAGAIGGQRIGEGGDGAGADQTAGHAFGDEAFAAGGAGGDGPSSSVAWRRSGV